MNNSNMPDLMEEITFSQSLKLSGHNNANPPRQIPELQLHQY